MKQLLVFTWLVLLSFVFLAHSSFALMETDSYSRQTLEKIKAQLHPEQTLRIYCAPCGDTNYKELVLKNLQTVNIDKERDLWTLQSDSYAIDLSSVYIKRKKRWQSLSSLVKIDLPGVPQFLEQSALDSLKLISSEHLVDKPLPDWSRDAWEGLYAAEEWYSPKGKVTKLKRVYQLDLSTAQKDSMATLSIDGPLSRQRIICQIEEKENNLEIKVKSYPLDHYGPTLPTGTNLFTLHRLPNGSLQTLWLKIKPSSLNSPQFKRIDETEKSSE